jgi:methionine-rich copper-binding protein CopC
MMMTSSVSRTASPALRGLLVGLLTIAGSASLLAHLAVTKTYPAKDAAAGKSPDHVQVWFSETPELSISSLTLAGPGGPVALDAVQSGEANSLRAAVKSTLAKGAYTVTYKTAGRDGHPLRGEFKFQVAPATTP